MTGATYEEAGVSISAGEEAVERIKDKVRSTSRPEVIGGIGGFGGMFAFPTDRYRQPVLVSATDGVGTKALVARAAGKLDTIGVDLVAMCVDDLVCLGAEPLFFLDYISTGKVDPSHMEQLVEGVAEGCRQAGCALVGGEMAEHPGAMDPDEFDLVGFAVGVAERDALITGACVSPGDAVIGLASPGLRSNGYSLARRVLLDGAGRSLSDPAYDGANRTLGEELLEPSLIYTPGILALLRAVEVHSIAHITGGGLPGNLSRVLPDTTDAVINPDTWSVPAIFGEIQRLGDVTDEEMRKVFNLGIGMTLIVSASHVQESLDVLRGEGFAAHEIGRIVPGEGAVRFG